MPYTPPNKIKINSDENEIEFTKVIKEKTGLKYSYTFIKSNTLLNKEILFSEDEICKYLSNETFKEI